MSITVNFSPADTALVQERAAAINVSIEEYIRQAVLKDANNYAYLAKLELSREQIQNGQVVTFSDDEWERFTHAQDI